MDLELDEQPVMGLKQRWNDDELDGLGDLQDDDGYKFSDVHDDDDDDDDDHDVL